MRKPRDLHHRKNKPAGSRHGGDAGMIDFVDRGQRPMFAVSVAKDEAAQKRRRLQSVRLFPVLAPALPPVFTAGITAGVTTETRMRYFRAFSGVHFPQRPPGAAHVDVGRQRRGVQSPQGVGLFPVLSPVLPPGLE